MASKKFRPQILVMLDIEDEIVEPFVEALDGKKTSKYFDEITQIGEVKKYVKKTFYGGNGSVNGGFSIHLILQVYNVIFSKV